VKTMGQSNSTVYSSLPNTANDFILSPLDDSDEDEEELFSSTNNQPDDELFLPSRSSSDEGWGTTLVQIGLPFLVAGLGMVAAGLVLDDVQHWPVFIEVPELFILVPALLGLKGNLEMTLASRLSTAANLGRLDKSGEASRIVIGNLALVQSQGIVVGFLASMTGLMLGWWGPSGSLNLEHGLLLCASSVVTASIASFILGLVMVLVILLSRKFNVNPDNVATPIAASLGDLTTLGLLSWMASLLWQDLDKVHDWILAPSLLAAYLLLTPFCMWIAWRQPGTREVLLHGWTPVLLAMLLSSAGGLILDFAVARWRGIAVFQPVMNGVGGNLVAVQASRLSTDLHCNPEGRGPGSLPQGEKAPCCPSPVSTLCGKDQHSTTSRILLLLVIPGHLLFSFTISLLEAGHTVPTLLFVITYLAAALLQVCLLLHICRILVPFLWGRGTDPDSAAIPYLTALGDLLGGGLLALAFVLLTLAGQEEEGSSKNVSDANLTSQAVTSLAQSLTSTLAPALPTLAQDLNQAGAS